MKNLDKKVHAPACERNRAPILESLQNLLNSATGTLLEIGSGTGQHAVYIAPAFPHLKWQTSDLKDKIANIELWRKESGIANINSAIELDISQHPWPIKNINTVFSSNTLHIVAWPLVIDFFTGVERVLCDKGLCIVYGPFNYQGKFTSNSNKQFDAWLKTQDPQSGIRDFEAVNEVACRQNLELKKDIEMPANNRLLVWQKK